MESYGKPRWLCSLSVKPNRASQYWLARFGFTDNEQSQRGLPYDSNDVVPRENPYPAPGSAENPKPFSGKYPHVEEGGGG